MNLQPQPGVQSIRQNPFGQVLGIDHAMGGIAASSRVLAKRRGQNYRADARIQFVLAYEVAREFIIPAAGDDKLHFVVAAQRVKVFDAKCVALAPSQDTLHPQS